MEPKDLIIASLKAHRFINRLKIDDIFKPVKRDIKVYIGSAFQYIMRGLTPDTITNELPQSQREVYQKLLNMYGVEVLHAHAPDISYLGLKWYIDGGDLVIGTDFTEDQL